MRNEIIKVEQSLPSKRLDAFLRERLQTVSRGTIQRLIEEGMIRVDGRIVKATHHPHLGENIEIIWPDAKPTETQPEEIPLNILFEDKDLLVLNKPPGMVVHPAAGHQEHTLVNALLHHCKGQLSGIGGMARPGIVHRLDKDTSGCLVIAKNDTAHLALSEQFSSRSVEKNYHAVVCGELTHTSGELRGAITRHPTHRKRMTVTQSKGRGREAHTTFRVLERLKGATLVEASIHTGRTHQIRVHFQHLGFPVFGDTTYGMRQTKRLVETAGYSVSRQMLHAFRLSFAHPVTGKKQCFEAPWPGDFEQAVSILKK